MFDALNGFRVFFGQGIVVGTGENSEFGEVFKMMQAEEVTSKGESKHQSISLLISNCFWLHSKYSIQCIEIRECARHNIKLIAYDVLNYGRHCYGALKVTGFLP